MSKFVLVFNLFVISGIMIASNVEGGGRDGGNLPPKDPSSKHHKLYVKVEFEKYLKELQIIVGDEKGEALNEFYNCILRSVMVHLELVHECSKKAANSIREKVQSAIRRNKNATEEEKDQRDKKEKEIIDLSTNYIKTIAEDYLANHAPMGVTVIFWLASSSVRGAKDITFNAENIVPVEIVDDSVNSPGDEIPPQYSLTSLKIPPQYSSTSLK